MVLEVGPGTGNMTVKLLEKAKKVEFPKGKIVIYILMFFCLFFHLIFAHKNFKCSQKKRSGRSLMSSVCVQVIKVMHGHIKMI